MTDAATAEPPPAHGRITALGLAVLVSLALLIAWRPGWVSWLQSAWFDAYQIALPRVVASTPVTVVEIDERSLARLGQWPWPRTLLAELIVAIQRRTPKAIGVDILMPEPDRMSPHALLREARRDDPVLASLLDALPSSDDALARALAASPAVLVLAGTPYPTQNAPVGPPFRIIDRARLEAPVDVADRVPRFAGVLMNLPVLDRAATGHAVVSAAPADSVIRQSPTVVRIGDLFMPSLAIEMLRVALRAPEVRLYAEGRAVERVAVGAFTVPTEADGQVRIHFSHRDSNRYVSAIDVLDGKVDAARLASKLVVVGVTGFALVDLQQTALGERMPGSEVHAQLLENLYDQSWLMRPAWARWAELALFVLLGAALVWTTPRWRPGHAALLAFGSMAALLAAGFGAFAWLRLVLDAAVPAFGLLLLFSVLLALSLAEAAAQRRALEQVLQRQREQAAYVAGELQAARRIQTGFLPPAGALRDEARVEIASSMTPAREVGGDLYDYFPLDAARLFFLLGDVSGKGLSASMFMGVSKALYKSVTLRSPDASVSASMRAANDEVSRDNPEMFFVTAFAGILDLDTGALAYCNAGHEDPYLLRSAHDVARLTGAAGPPLCTVEGFAYEAGARQLARGELLCIVTDGVADARSPAGERYGSERLRAVLARVAGGEATARALVDAIVADVRGFVRDADLADDMTILALRWNGPRESTAP